MDKNAVKLIMLCKVMEQKGFFLKRQSLKPYTQMYLTITQKLYRVKQIYKKDEIKTSVQLNQKSNGTR